MTQQPQQALPRKRFPWLYLILFIFIVGLLLNSIMASNAAPRLSQSEFERQLVASQDATLPSQIPFAMIIQQGNTFFILSNPPNGVVTPAQRESFRNDPSRHANLQFFANTYDAARISAMISLRNAFIYDGTGNSALLIEFHQLSVPQSLIDTIFPFLWIGLILFIAFFIFRSFASRGGLGNMGAHRATRIFGGSTRFSDVAGIEEEKEEVQEIVEFLRNPRKFLDMGARIPKGCLLVGAPGTGKTLLAKAIAGEAGVPFLSLSGSDFSEMLVGVGPSRMRNLFEEAKANAPCIIFIDEIDSIARMRGVGISGASDENEQTLNQLLVQMDGFSKSEGVIVLAATNRPDVLDQALLRPGRFDRQIVVQIPDVKGREKILEVHSRHKPLGKDVDLKRVAKIISGFSGADIENLMNESAIIAAKKNKVRINMIDIQEGINKVILGPQKRSRIITEQDKKITAYHEAGHAIVSRILQKDHIVQEVSIIPRGMAAGYTLFNDKDGESHHKSKAFLNSHLAVYMGGRIAEQLFIGDICTGSSGDLKSAMNIAEKMVTSYGMSEKLGPLYYGKEAEIALRKYNEKNISESLQSLIDSEIKAILVAAEKQSRDILKANASKAHVMANVLLERETIYAEDIELIMNGKTEKQVIAEMEKREKTARAQEKKDMAENALASIDREMKVTHEQAVFLFENNMRSMDEIVKLESNMKLAREMTREGNRPKVLPTLDNLDTYVNMVKVEDSQKEEVDATDPEVAIPEPQQEKEEAKVETEQAKAESKPKTPRKK